MSTQHHQESQISSLDRVLSLFPVLQKVRQSTKGELQIKEVGEIRSIGHGVAQVTGLPGAQAEEMIRFPGNRLGMAFNLDPDNIGVVLLDHDEGIAAGMEVERTGKVVDVPVGASLLGRIVDALGRPLDDGAQTHALPRLPVERAAPSILDRAPVSAPLQTGITVIDAVIPIGRGQRQLVLGDRQTGKTTIGLQAILNQSAKDVLCVYCAIGQRASTLAKVIADLRAHHALERSIIVATTEADPPGLQVVTPFAAMSMAESLMEQGHDVLVVLDDLTRHARAYRQLSLLLRRPPGREAYPGDIFYLHSRLLERSTHLRSELGGGSITALAILETEGQSISSYISTNLISITDGQIFLSPGLFQKGILPAIDIGRSVSRVGGKAQYRSYREVAGDLRLIHAQFEELEAFARFGARLDSQAQRRIERGLRARELLKQGPYELMSVADQIVALEVLNHGALDSAPANQVRDIIARIRQQVYQDVRGLPDQLNSGSPLHPATREQLIEWAQTIVSDHSGQDQ